MRKNVFIFGIISLMLFTSNVLFIVVVTNGSTNELTILASPTLESREDYTPIGIMPTALPDTLFNITAMTNTGIRSDYLKYAQSDLAEIGINIELQNLSWTDFVNQLTALREYDLCYVGIAEIMLNGIEGLYTEDGSLNLFNYEEMMDWETSLGAGLNEWYIRMSELINPPDSGSRINHIWEWQQYLMDELLLLLPGFGSQDYMAYWSNLEGYNYTDGFHQSWGDMYWDGAHTGQSATNEFVMNGGPWTDLNPLFSYDSDSAGITRALLDTLLWKDSDQEVYPHILSNYVYMNNTWVRLTVRDNIEWADDPDGLFTNEFVDIEDVYFSLYCYEKVSSLQPDFSWIKDMRIINDFTLDLFIDDDGGTPDNEPNSQVLDWLSYAKLLPEHYLNQTQTGDGVTPDITHASWDKFTNQTFGTGLFELDSFTPGSETNLTVNPDCWWLDPTITSDPNLDWSDRFGTFSSSLDTLVIKVINDFNVALSDFESGKLDLFTITTRQDKIEEYGTNPDIDVESKIDGQIGLFGFNVDDGRTTPLQSRTTCPHNSALTIGLAVRKAVAYAIDRERINTEINNDTRIICHHPISPHMGIWLNPNIIKYDYNLTKAKEHMYFAGFETGLDSDGDNLTDIYEAEVSFSNRFSNDSDGDGLTDWQEVTIHGTDPADSDTDSDGLNDYDEIYTYLTDPFDIDSDDDELLDGSEIIVGTNPLDADSDDDGMTDGWEVGYGLDPLINDEAEDPDSDGLTNWNEFVHGTNPQVADTDGDGINDGDEVADGFDPLDPNDPPTNGFGLEFLVVPFMLFLALGIYGLMRRIRK